MLTRRAFFASVAALAVGARVAPVAVAPRLTVSLAALPLLAELRRLEMDVLRSCPRRDDSLDRAMYLDGRPRRDDGDTILELR